jgi:predicted RNA-binding Zn ribbon-like protein
VGDVARIELIGGHPAVDFVNTLGGGHQALDECVHTYDDLLVWAERARVIDPGQAPWLRSLAGERPREAERVLADARLHRSDVDQVLRAAVAREEAPVEALDRIRDVHARAISAAHLQMPAKDGSRGYTWTWPRRPDDLAFVVWASSRYVLDFLRSADVHRLKCCAGCRWLFLDESRNHSRRWCSMNTCGAHAKMRRYRAGQTRTSTPAD